MRTLVVTRHRLVVVALACAFVLGSSVPATAVPDAAPSAGRTSETVRVRMADRYRNVFRPRTVRIERGDSVRWVNVGNVTHTATTDTWDSGAVNPGERYVRRFRRVGEFRYRCVLHPEMTGVVVVA